MLGGAVICSRCWMGNSWFEEKWERGSSLPDTFIPPFDKSLRDFPAPSADAEYIRVFDGMKMSDSREMSWDEGNIARYDRYLEYAKEHGLMMDLRGALSPAGSSDTVVALTGEKKVNLADVRFYGDVFLIVQAKPKVLYEKPLPPRRPVELRTAKAEFLRSAEVLRTRYINELLEMLKKAETQSDDLAADNVKRELKSLALPKESDAKELTKLLIGKWKPLRDRSAPFYRDNGTRSYRLNVDDEVVVQWHVEGNEVVESWRYNDEIVTRRSLIILLNTTRFVYVVEAELLGGDVNSEARIIESKRR